MGYKDSRNQLVQVAAVTSWPKSFQDGFRSPQRRSSTAFLTRLFVALWGRVFSPADDSPPRKNKPRFTSALTNSTPGKAKGSLAFAASGHRATGPLPIPCPRTTSASPAPDPIVPLTCSHSHSPALWRTAHVLRDSLRTGPRSTAHGEGTRLPPGRAHHPGPQVDLDKWPDLSWQRARHHRPEEAPRRLLAPGRVTTRGDLSRAQGDTSGGRHSVSTGILEQIAARLTAIESQLATLAEQVRAPALPGDDSIWADGVLSVTKAPEFCGVCKRQLWELMDRGELPWTKPARDRLIPRRALVALLATHARAAEAVS